MEEIVQDILVNVVLAVIMLLSSFALYYIRKATAKLAAETALIGNEDQRQLIQDAIGRLDDVATKTVMTIEQTTAKELRQAVKDGRVDKEEMRKLSEKAYWDIVGTLKPEYISVLESTVGDLERYIQNTIESKVLALKGAG